MSSVITAGFGNSAALVITDGYSSAMASIAGRFHSATKRDRTQTVSPRKRNHSAVARVRLQTVEPR